MSTTETQTDSIRWDLSDLFHGTNDPKIHQFKQEIIELSQQFATNYKGKIKTFSDTQLLQAFTDQERISERLYKLSQYSHLVYATDTSDTSAQKLMAEIDELGSDIQNQVLFFKLELAHVSDEVRETWIRSNALSAYHYKIKRSGELARYQLTEPEEQLINLKDLCGSDAFQQLYSEFTSSFEFEFKVDGELKKLNGSQLRALRQHHDPDTRRQAMKLFYEKYEENKVIFTKTFNAILKNHSTEKKLRGYKTDISMMNVGNDLDDTVIDILHQITEESYPLVHRYYKLKRKMLNLDQLTLADIYAPLPNTTKTYSFQEAKDIVLSSFNEFDSDFYEKAKLMFDQNRIDVPVEKNKRGGAFCSSSTSDINPYVLLNFQGRSRDVSTLAHELGHAIHALYCQPLPLLTSHAILPLCETASVFCEMIVTDKLRQQATSNFEKQLLLSDKLEDIFATSHRQNMFSSFEKDAHEKISAQLQSADDLCQLYRKHLTAMFGDSVTYTNEYNWEWATIPHFIDVPFYVYAYNFGNLLVMAIYQMYKADGEAIIPKLKRMLSLGSSKSPYEICQTMDIDITDRAFWKKSIDYIESLIVELESLQ